MPLRCLCWDNPVFNDSIGMVVVGCATNVAFHKETTDLCLDDFHLNDAGGVTGAGCPGLADALERDAVAPNQFFPAVVVGEPFDVNLVV